MMEYDELELEKLGDEKIALFAVVSDSDPTFNFISEHNMLLTLPVSDKS